MPYSKPKKRKCRKADGSSGSWVVDKELPGGKTEQSSCHDSEDKASASIRARKANEVDVPYGEEINEDIARILIKEVLIEASNLTPKEMDETTSEDRSGCLLQEHIRELLAESKQSKLSSDKLLGYLAEWSTWEALTGMPGFPLAVSDDKRIKRIYPSASGVEKKQYEDMYGAMLDAAAAGVDNVRSRSGLSLSNAIRPDQAPSTALVDVITDDADIHIKFNDPSRLCGLQRPKKDVPGSATTAIFDNVISTFMGDTGVDLTFVDKKGKLRRPAGVKGMDDKTGAELAAAKKLKNEFDASRDQYRTSLTNSKDNPANPGRREAFIAALDKAGIRDAIKIDVEDRLLDDGSSDDTRPPIYFKYFPKAAGITLKTEQYQISNFVVVPNKKETTTLYKVTSAAEDEVYFEIEFRLDGGGHPPQIKAGPDLDVACSEESVAGSLSPALSPTPPDKKFNVRTGLDSRLDMPGPDSEMEITLAASYIRDAVRNILQEELTRTDKMGILEDQIPESKTRLIVEELTGADKSDIKRMIAKEIDGAANKKATRKIFLAEFDREFKKMIDSKPVKDSIRSEVESIFKNKATKKEIAEVTKAVIKKLYRELSYSSVHIVDRIKI